MKRSEKRTYIIGGQTLFSILARKSVEDLRADMSYTLLNCGIECIGTTSSALQARRVETRTQSLLVDVACRYRGLSNRVTSSVNDRG